MKHRLLATVALGALSVGTSEAADMRQPALKTAAPVAVVPACAQFGGLYIGAQGGLTHYSHRWQDHSGFIKDNLSHETPDSAEITKSGWNAGVVGGYNFQARCTVFGIEADWNWANTKAETRFSTADGEDVYVRSKMKWFGTVRARTGVVVDNLFLYVTGGVAWARFDRTFRLDDSGDVDIFFSKNTRLGWTAGVGTEWAIGNSWSLKGDVLYMSFPTKEASYTSVNVDAGDIFRVSNRDSAWVGRIGLNYRWGGAAPLVARF